MRHAMAHTDSQADDPPGPPFRGLRTLALAVLATVWLLVFRSTAATLDGLTVHVPLMATMVLGSFVAGISAAGGGAVAFPVMTLLLAIRPVAARDFALFIQSAGMTAASLAVGLSGTPGDWRLYRTTAPVAVVGLLAADSWLAPLLDPRSAKLAFGTVWLAFGVALALINAHHGDYRRTVVSPRGRCDWMLLVVVALLGGALTALFGSGLDLAVFSMAVLWFGLCEKVGTPTSVVLMATLSVVGTVVRLWAGGVTALTVERWLACVPVVIVGAPLGALVCARLPRRAVAMTLSGILVVQFVGTIVVLRPSFDEGSIMVAVAVSSLALFAWLARQGGSLRPN